MKAPATVMLVALGFALGLATGLGIGNRAANEAQSPSLEAPTAQIPKTSVTSLEAPPPFERPTHAEPTHETRVEVAGAVASAHAAAQGRNSGSIKVTVLDALGAPLADAAVSERAESSDSHEASVRFSNARRLLTNAAGQITLERVPWGEHRVYAERDGVAPGVSEAVRVSIEAPEVSTTLTLTTGGAVVGELRDVSGALAASIGLSIHPNRARSGPSAISLRQVETDRNGAFAFEHLPAGLWDLYTRAQGAEKMRIPDQHLLVDVREGQTTRAQFEDLVATAVRVSGQVLRNGEPLSGARVMTSSAGPGRRSGTQSNADTDADGRFQILLQEAGEYRFSVAQRQDDSSTRIVSFPVTVPQTAQHDVVLAFMTGSLSGRVTLANGDPAQGVDVRLMQGKSADRRSPSGGGSVSTNVEGRYSFTGVPAGRYRLQASASNDAPVHFAGFASTDDIVLEPGAVLKNVDIQMSAGGAVQGRVLRGDGTAVAGAQIDVRSEKARNSGTSDQHGNFRLDGLIAESYWLRATFEGDCSGWVPVEIAVNSTAKKDLSVAAGTIVLVEVVDANGPAAEAMVTLSFGNEVSSDGVIVRNGRGQLGPLAPGRYAVTLVRDGRENTPKVESSILLAGEAERVLQLRLP